MGLEALTSSVRGSILLLNVFDTIKERLLEPRDEKNALLGLAETIDGLSDPSDHDLVMKELFKGLGPQSHRYQVAAVRTAPSDVHLAAVRGFDDVKELLKQIAKKHKWDRRLRNAIAANATASALRDAASIINHYSDEMTRLLLSGPYNIFFATTRRAFSTAESLLAGMGDDEAATAIRDHLGLVQVEPISSLQPMPLFVFESLKTVGEMENEFRVARPTTIDGFDNRRFRQSWSKRAYAQASGGGLTVYLRPGFGEGMPEFVATGLPLKGNFKCRYLGSVLRPAAGNDVEFLSYLMHKRRLSLDEMALRLNKLVADARAAA
jgi:hypothetical protein